MVNRLVTCLMTSHDPVRSSHDPNMFGVHYLDNGWIQTRLQYDFCRTRSIEWACAR